MSMISIWREHLKYCLSFISHLSLLVLLLSWKFYCHHISNYYQKRIVYAWINCLDTDISKVWLLLTYLHFVDIDLYESVCIMQKGKNDF